MVEVNPLALESWACFCLDPIHYHGHGLTILWDKTDEHYGKAQGRRVFADGTQIAMPTSLRLVTGPLP